jgi:hypothetical protein
MLEETKQHYAQLFDNACLFRSSIVEISTDLPGRPGCEIRQQVNPEAGDLTKQLHSSTQFVAYVTFSCFPFLPTLHRFQYLGRALSDSNSSITVVPRGQAGDRNFS